MPNQKTEEHGYFSKSEKPRLNRFYSRGRVAYCSIQNLRKASGLSKKKGENFSGHRIQNWVVSKSVVSQDLKLYLNTSMKSVWTWFSRFVIAQTMKTKCAIDTLQDFRKMISRRKTP